MTNTYNINITHEIITQETLAKPLASGGSQASGASGAAKGPRLSGRALISGGTQLLAATGQNELASKIGEVTKYTMLGARVLSGDPTAALMLSVDLACKAITAVRDWQAEEKRKRIEARQQAERTARYGQTFKVAYRATF